MTNFKTNYCNYMQLQSEMDHISQRSVLKEALEKWTEFIPKAFQIAESEDNSNINYFLKVTCNSAEEYSGGGIKHCKLMHS